MSHHGRSLRSYHHGPALTKAHADLDRAVDRCYRKEPFPNDCARVEHRFALYETLTAPLTPTAKKAKK